MRCPASAWSCAGSCGIARTTRPSRNACCRRALIGSHHAVRTLEPAAAARSSISTRRRNWRSSRRNCSRISRASARDTRPATVLEPLRGPAWNYRRRARLGVKHVPRKGKVLVGFRERSAPYVADLHECHVLVEPRGPVVRPLAALVESLSIINRVPQVEVAVADDAVALVLRVLDPPTPGDLLRWRSSNALTGCVCTCSRAERHGAAALGRRDCTAIPAPRIRREYRVRADGLRAGQRRIEHGHGRPRVGTARRDGARRSARPVLRTRQFLATHRPCAQPGSSGSRAMPTLVARARANAVRNGSVTSSSMRPICSRTSPRRPGPLAGTIGCCSTPREPEPVKCFRIVAGSGARRVVYISCHPGSLARDAGMLVREHGFRLAAAGVMDMFPHTTHVEAMAVFDR